jgi:hypothetical protein
LVPELRGPLIDSDFVLPSINDAEHLYFRYMPKEQLWTWTNDAQKQDWHPVSLKLLDGFANMKSDADVRQIMEFLEKTRAEPPLFDESETADLDTFIQGRVSCDACNRI